MVTTSDHIFYIGLSFQSILLVVLAFSASFCFQVMQCTNLKVPLLAFYNSVSSPHAWSTLTQSIIHFHHMCAYFLPFTRLSPPLTNSQRPATPPPPLQGRPRSRQRRPRRLGQQRQGRQRGAAPQLGAPPDVQVPGGQGPPRVQLCPAAGRQRVLPALAGDDCAHGTHVRGPRGRRGAAGGWENRAGSGRFTRDCRSFLCI